MSSAATTVAFVILKTFDIVCHVEALYKIKFCAISLMESFNFLCSEVCFKWIGSSL